MKEKRKDILFWLLLIIVIVGSLLSVVRLNPTENTEEKIVNSLELVEEHNNGIDIYEYVDEETGVHYVIYTKKVYKGGAGGICPRYNADGTLYVTESGETNEQK